MRIGLISDTHGLLRAAICDHFQGVEVILHAGDVGGEDILTELEAIAPVHAVVGNTDGFPLIGRIPEVQQLELENHRIVVTHGHRLGSPTPQLLRNAHPDADVIVYGHTHKPLIDRSGGALVINPGAAGPARFRLKPSIALLQIAAGAEPVVTLIEL
jgi:putative phosphoesterase